MDWTAFRITDGLFFNKLNCATILSWSISIDGGGSSTLDFSHDSKERNRMVSDQDFWEATLCRIQDRWHGCQRLPSGYLGPWDVCVQAHRPAWTNIIPEPDTVSSSNRRNYVLLLHIVVRVTIEGTIIEEGTNNGSIYADSSPHWKLSSPETCFENISLCPMLRPVSGVLSIHSTIHCKCSFVCHHQIFYKSWPSTLKPCRENSSSRLIWF